MIKISKLEDKIKIEFVDQNRSSTFSTSSTTFSVNSEGSFTLIDRANKVAKNIGKYSDIIGSNNESFNTAQELSDFIDALTISPSSSSYLHLTDSDTNLKFRATIRSSQYCVDKEKTSTGFNGVEGVDWENIGGFK